MTGQPKVARTSLATYVTLKALAEEAGVPDLDMADLVDYAYRQIDKFGSKSSQAYAVGIIRGIIRDSRE